MKTLRLICTLSLLIIVLASSATIWRVNNRPNVDADFSTLIAAYNAAAPNDTLYVEGSPTNYGILGLYKPITLIGSGFWLDENDTTQAYKETSKVNTIYFYSGSQGSVIEGFHIQSYGNYGTSGIEIHTSNITVRRNRITTQSYFNSQISRAIRIVQVVNSIVIEQNWLEPVSPTDGYGFGVYINNYVSNSYIENNIIFCDTNHYAIYLNQEVEASSLIISNNAIMGDITTYYSAQYNNILIYGTYTEGTGDSYSNNLCNATQYPAINGNQQNVDMTTVFEDYTSYIDNGYFLKTGSPAIGAGIGGVDCGPFGTNDPYVLSGMPPIPAIFDFEMIESIGTTTLPVTIKAKSHK
jgi:hypothetical protein